MGPASIAAEIFRPQATDALAAQSKKAAADDNRFEDYLDEAQGVSDDCKSKDVDTKKDTSDTDAPASDDHVTEDNSDAAAAQAAAQAAVANVIVQDAPVATDEAAGQNATAPVKTASIDPSQFQASAAQNAADDGTAQAANVQVQDNSESKTVRRANDASSHVDVQRPQPVENAVDAQSKLSAALKDSATTAGEANLKSDVAEDGDAKPAEPVQVRPIKVERPADNPTVPSNESQIETALKQTNRDHDSIVPRETVQQRKVREATEARRVESANAAANQPEKKKADKNDSGTAGGQGDRASRVAGKGNGTQTSGISKSGAFAARLESIDNTARVSTTTTQTASIKSGVGDSAAVSAARFLISNPTSTANTATIQPATGNGPSTGTFTNIVNSAGAASNNIVSDLLTSGADKSGGVDGMARVLNASGVPGRYQATLRLDPPTMGTVRVQLNLQQEGLSIQVDTQSRHVSKLIESRLDDLREALSAHGIRVDRADIVTKSPQGSEASTTHDHANHHQEQQSATGDADYQMPRDAQGQSDSSFGGTHWQNADGGVDTPAIGEMQNDTTQGSAGPRSGAYGFAPGAVDLVA